MSHVVAVSLIVDVVAVPVRFMVLHPTLSATCEILDSCLEIGVSFVSTTVESLGDLLKFAGPGSNLALGNREKCPKLWNRFELSVKERLEGGIGGRGAVKIGAAGDGCGCGGRISTVDVPLSLGGAVVDTVELGVGYRRSEYRSRSKEGSSSG